MRVLLLFRGSAGCGKSTYIKEHNLEPYALSADELRMRMQSPVLNIRGTTNISQKNDKDVWNTLFNLLEKRMERGEFTVIDATNSKTSEMSRYKEMADKYRYRIYIVDMTDLPIEECKRRNKLREPHKIVPEAAIDKMYARFETQKIPSGITVIKPDELDKILYRPLDLNGYKKIHHIGDQHGCFSPIYEYLRTQYFGFNYDIEEYWRSDRWLSLDDFEGEIWKDIKGYEDYYQISNYGRIKSLSKIKSRQIKEENIYILRKGYQDYLYVNLSKNSKKKTFKVHKLVWEHFTSEKSDEINHKDGLKVNNNIKNLEPSTRTENEKHCWENGLKKGRAVEQYDLNDELICRYNSIKEASEKTGIGKTSIIHCCKGDVLTAGGFKWKYAEEIDGNRSGKPIRIAQYDLDGNFIEEYNSIKEAERAVGVQTIRGCLAGNLKTAGGYLWEAIDIDYKENSKSMIYNENYLKSLLKEDEFYIFTGDYIDRGIENVELLKFLISIYKLPNIMLLEGNHEASLRNFASNIDDYTRNFKETTLPQLNKAVGSGEIKKNDLRQLCRKFGQVGYYTYQDKKVLVCHGGISGMKENLIYVSTEQIMRGVGEYGEYVLCAKAFEENTDENTYQISGHRNIEGVKVHATDRCFNLEGQVESGGHLRVVTLDENGFETYEIKNNVFREKEEKIIEEKFPKEDLTNEDIINSLRQSKFVNEKEMGNISSFNFTRDAFYKKEWNEQTTSARGLFIDTSSNEIAARGYKKFFNVNERDETKIMNLKSTLKFPVTAYVKENGFLGLISYNKDTDDLMFATKSVVDYAAQEEDLVNVFKELYMETATDEQKQNLLAYVKSNNKTIVCECVHQDKDPHIIEYDSNRIYLLDIINNDFDGAKESYDELCNASKLFGLTCKEKAFVFDCWEDFYGWYLEITDEDYKYNDRYIEGFVIQDSDDFMVKFKLAYYNFWKMMRGVSHTVLKVGYINKTSSLYNATANYYYGWLKEHRDEFIYRDEKGKIKFDDINIIKLRKRFLEENK